MPIVGSNGVDENQKRREDFYEALKKFTSCLQIALQSVAFYQDTEFTEQDRNDYKDTLKYMDSLRRIVMADTGETINFHHYDDKMKKLFDRHISGIDIQEPTGAYVIDPAGKNRPVTKEEVDNWSEDKKRNESELIRSRIAKKIDDITDDPYAKTKLSEDVQKILEEIQGSFDFDKNFLHLQEFEKDVDARKIDGIPAPLQKNAEAQAYYGIFRLAFPDLFLEPLSEEQEKKWVDFALVTQEIVTKARNENGLNQTDMEKAIKRGLRQTIRENFEDNTEITDHRKALIEEIIQNVRIRYENAAA